VIKNAAGILRKVSLPQLQSKAIREGKAGWVRGWGYRSRRKKKFDRDLHKIMQLWRRMKKAGSGG
jgi:hypothetical protein